MEQHTTCSLQGCLDQLSKVYSAGSGRPLVLDARPSQAYHQQRLQGAANLPLLHLRERCFLLPDKNTPFAVLAPANSYYTIVQDQQQHGQLQQDGSAAVCLAGTSGLEEFLTSRRWQVSCALRDTPHLWEAARQLQLLEGPLPRAVLGRRWLFRPAAILEHNISRVEQLLLSQPAKDGSSQGRPRVLRALDLGCGSGRDVVWLASRHRAAAEVGAAGVIRRGEEAAAASTGSPIMCISHTAHQEAAASAEVEVAPTFKQASGTCSAADKPQSDQQQRRDALCHEQQEQEQEEAALPGVVWQVVGLDEWHGALVRGQQLAQQAGLPPTACCWCMARVEPTTWQLVQLAPPPGSPLEQQQAPTCGSGSGTWVCGEQDTCGVQGSLLPASIELAAGNAAAARSCGIQLGSFDLLLCVRFLERALLPVLASLLRPGGVLMYCTFVEGPGLAAYGRPAGRDRVLEPGELGATWFGEQQGFKVLQDEVMLSDDGRELSFFVAMKLLAR